MSNDKAIDFEESDKKSETELFIQDTENKSENNYKEIKDLLNEIYDLALTHFN